MPPPSLCVCRQAFVLAEDEALAPEVARRGESVLRASLVALTMTLVCYWWLGAGASGSVDEKTKRQGKVSNDRGGTIPSLTGGAGPDERWAGLGKQRSRQDERWAAGRGVVGGRDTRQTEQGEGTSGGHDDERGAWCGEKRS